MARSRLDQRLVTDGLLPDLKTAQAWIIAGDVLVGGAVCNTAGTQVPATAAVALRRPVEKFVSRGGLKLEAALQRFSLPVAGKVVLDAGASTGGFTDCLVQHQARKVYAVDVGFGQLRGKLGSDPRVVNLERTNISDLRAEVLDPPIDLAVFDLSYLSATRTVPILMGLFEKPVSIVGLVKPLFEGVQPADMQDPESLRQALHRVMDAMGALGLSFGGLIPSPILGKNGTVEFLLWLLPGPPLLDGSHLRDQALLELRTRPPET
jgi:23S rRNA (cytidine1920-2'-O)/16S rRNA (cytidine1409-2'-O)-methyltransferase